MEKPAVRMFIGEFGTVRWETTIKHGSVLELVVKGPSEAVTVHQFRDPLSLVEFQSLAERRLVNAGYGVAALTERRSGVERRSKVRTKERRRP